MVLDTIQLGAKRPQGKSLSSAKLRGFFYGGDIACESVIEARTKREYPLQVKNSAPHGRYFCSTCGTAKPCNPARQHLIFYDNPSQKRDARCTNILHTGAILSGVGEGQRLRKGFQGQQRSSVGGRERLRLELETVSSRYKTTILQALSVTLFASIGITCANLFFESSSSAAEIRHSARNTRL